MAQAPNNQLLIEASWEICNQLGGIYTVIRSKLPATIEKFGSNYCLLGPLINDGVDAEFEAIAERDSPIGQAVAELEIEAEAIASLT